MAARVLAVAALMLLAASSGLSAQARGSSSAPHVLAEPSAGHSGDPIYVSGSGFPARSHIVLFEFCTGLSKPVIAGPGDPFMRTDASGRFVAYGIRGARLNRSSPVTCRITAQASGASHPSTPGVRYSLFPRSMKLPSCATRICVHLTATLLRLRSETRGTVVITAWPGATATVSITGPGARTIARSTRLNWRGVGSVEARVSLGLIRGVTRRASVTVRFGHWRGTATAQFVIVPGGH